jgi:hypothetical protein
MYFYQPNFTDPINTRDTMDACLTRESYAQKEYSVDTAI